MRFLTAALIFCGVASFGQAPKVHEAPQVPHKMHLGGLTLTISNEARQEIQKDVDALTISPRYFNIKVERAKTYFPIIEKIFREENIPDELKYLVIQESALISDAVSTSNAVGYWQFKAETARQMGLKVNRQVDERMNIVASSKGAARYFKESNAYFNNWLLAVQSYQMGIGGTMRSVGEEHLGSRHMDVTPATYWYVKKYLAHKVAFEHALGGPKGQVAVTAIMASGVSLGEISQKSGVDIEKLKDYNKWIKDGTVPDDADYIVVIPKGDIKDFNTLWLSSTKKTTATTSASAPTAALMAIKETEINGLRAVVAQQRESVTVFANRTKTDLSDFIKWNDVTVDWTVRPGDVYYLQRKIRNSPISTYTAKEGDNLWKVSQTNGIRLKTLRRLNPSLSDQLLPSTVVYLADQPGRANFSKAQIVELDPSSPFEWGISGKSENDYLIKISDTDQMKESPNPTDQVAVPSSQPPPFQVSEHVVAVGETLYTIAKRYGLKVADLVRLNNLGNDSNIKPGQPIRLRDEAKVPAQRTIHEVKPSDTLFTISRQYGLTVKELMEINDKKDFDLKPGQKLIIR